MKKTIMTLAATVCLRLMASAQCEPVNLPYSEGLSGVQNNQLPECYYTYAETFTPNNLWEVSNSAPGFEGSVFSFNTDLEYDGTVAASLHLRKLNLEAGKTYRLSYKCRNSIEQFKLFSLYPDIRLDGNPSVYDGASIVYDGTLTEESEEFDVTVSGAYNLSFILYTTSNTGDFYLDDILVEEVGPTSGIEAVDATVLKVYPNPVKDRLYISTTAAVDEVAIYNATGQLVQTSAQPVQEAGLDLSALANGMYFVHVASGKTTTRLKVIKE